jgi:Fe2+ transport system protein B
MEEEAELIQKNITSLSGKLEVLQESLYNDELGLTNIEKTVEKWRKLTLKAMEDSKLLNHYHLNSASSAEELTNKLEEAAKKSDNAATALRQCLSSISYA